MSELTNIFLPNLLKITIRNFNLYPNAHMNSDSTSSSLIYDFVDGINLIIGGNGTGKTTFINIIKFGLIGIYDSPTEMRMYKEERRDKRSTRNYNYFKDRMISDINNPKATVTLDFEINGTQYSVTRNLYSPSVCDLTINEVRYTSDDKWFDLPQKEYDKFLTMKKKDQPLSFINSLQNILETSMIETTKINSFDSIIFLINSVLIFDEAHNMILWDNAIQTKLFSKIFLDPDDVTQLDAEYLSEKYYDSLSRHRSEDIRAITKVLESDKSIKHKKVIDIVKSKEKINTLQTKEALLESNLSDIKFELRSTHTKRYQLQEEEKSVANTIGFIEDEFRSIITSKISPLQYDGLQFIEKNHCCPYCNNSLEDSKYDELHCVFCGHDVYYSISDENLENKKNEIEKLYSSHNQIKHQINQITTFLVSLEDQAEKMYELQRNIKLELISLQAESLKYNDVNKDASSGADLIYKRLQELEKEKQEYKDKSDLSHVKILELTKKMNMSLRDITKRISSSFASYATTFSGMTASLKFSQGKNGEYFFIPILNEIQRIDQFSLSESQGFFVDQSFRFSVFDLIYKSTGFFICETPNSSLDIAYEKQAASMFLDYISKGNKLIISHNVNQSVFIKQLMSRTNINILDLLQYGRITNVQSSDTEIVEIINDIKEKSNG